MDVTSSNFNLLILNLWIGLCRGARGLPQIIRELGYRDRWIERTFQNQDLEQVCPEIIITSALLRHSVLIETKSGPNTDNDQLRRYSRVSRQDLEQRVQLSPEECESHDCCVIGLADHATRLQIGIENGGYSFPLIVGDERGLRLVYNHFQRDQTTAAFAPLLEVNWSAVPNYIPINSESSMWEVAEVVLPIVMEFMQKRETRIEVDQICVKATSTWGALGRPGRDQLRAKVRAILDEASQHEFSGFIRFNRGNGSTEITNNPLDLPIGKTTAAYKTFATQQRKFLRRLRGGSQLELFES